jgi:TonB family protein
MRRRRWIEAALAVVVIASVAIQAHAQTRPPPPPPSPPKAGGIRVGSIIGGSRKVKDVRPIYPDAAERAGIVGVVLLEIAVDADGRVSDANVVRSIPLLNQAAIDAAKQWRYSPILLNGVRVPVIMTATVEFPPRPRVRLRIAVPMNSTLSSTFLIAAAGTRTPVNLGLQRYGFEPTLQDPTAPIKVSIYDLSGPARLLGSVEVELGSGVVHSQTAPSFDIELMAIELP